MVRVLSFLIRYFSNYYTLHHSDLTARAAPLDPRLLLISINFLIWDLAEKPAKWIARDIVSWVKQKKNSAKFNKAELTAYFLVSWVKQKNKIGQV